MTEDKNTSEAWAILPLKDLSGAKRRLGSDLSDGERHDLAHAMARDVITALKQAKKINQILIVSNDREVTELAVELEVHLIHEGPEPGLSAAVTHGGEHLCTKSIPTMIVVHGDLPLASANEIDALVTEHEKMAPPCATIQTCTNSDGTNVLAISPPDVMAFSYGAGSFAIHLRQAKERGIEVATTSLESLAIDIDTAEDLAQFIKCMNRTESAENTKLFLTSSGIAGRFVDQEKQT